ncbi:MAG: lactonase family protein [Actinomycetota bacterium]|nr:lactonase family protein [Actinomycetota bacterium]
MILVAARGAGPEHGLHVAVQHDGEWMTRHLDTVEQLAALAPHPSRPLAYGLSGLERGRLLAWNVADVAAGGSATRLVDRDALGDISCDLAVDPGGRLLVAAHYGYETGAGGSLTVWRLDELGMPFGNGVPIVLVGSGADPVRQPVPHPHQVVFHDGALHVPDLGTDTIRRFALSPDDAERPLAPLEPIPVPVGTGPRHMVILGSGASARVVVSGELSGELAVGSLDPARPAWRTVVATRRTGPAVTRTDRNYPGDVKVSADGRYAYFANRGYDTLATIELGDEGPALVEEVQAQPWPQHILVRDGEVLLACWDGSSVLRARLEGGVAGELEFAFACPGAGWLLEMGELSHPG